MKKDEGKVQHRVRGKQCFICIVLKHLFYFSDFILSEQHQKYHLLGCWIAITQTLSQSGTSWLWSSENLINIEWCWLDIEFDMGWFMGWFPPLDPTLTKQNKGQSFIGHVTFIYTLNLNIHNHIINENTSFQKKYNSKI